MTSSNLSRTHFNGASCVGANLTRNDFSIATLLEVDLRRADLIGSKFDKTSKGGSKFYARDYEWCGSSGSKDN
ncbi:pentapeptide repeat-containing protein [Amycolatopsis sp. NPDC051372]|uniref:pentapeptide repeat-containing protein n=1 Tax=unclassified Amycolatopsis TaxID=2618356 RepID=UPI003436BB35